MELEGGPQHAPPRLVYRSMISPATVSSRPRLTSRSGTSATGVAPGSPLRCGVTATMYQGFWPMVGTCAHVTAAQEPPQQQVHPAFCPLPPYTHSEQRLPCTLLSDIKSSPDAQVTE